ncbi:hypothetical protein D9M69_446240 [compost metagenome]
MAVGEGDVEAAHDVDRLVVLQVGLGDVHQHLVAVAVVGRAVLLVGDGEAAADLLAAAADRLRGAPVVVVAVAEAAAHADFAAELRRAGRALPGDDVDDAAGSAAAVHRAGAGQHLDALDVERVDGIELAADAARAVQRHAVDHHQGAAPAQVLAEVGAPLRADVEAGDQLAEGFLERHAGLGLLLQLGAVDHPHGAGQLADAGRRARADHHGAVDFHGQPGELQGVAAVAGHRAQASALEQAVEAVGHAVAAVQALGLAVGGQLRAERQQHAGLRAELVECRLQRPGGDVELLAAFLLLGGDGRQAGSDPGHGQAETENDGLQGAAERRAGEAGNRRHRDFSCKVVRSFLMALSREGRKKVQRDGKFFFRALGRGVVYWCRTRSLPERVVPPPPWCARRTLQKPTP